MSVFWAKLTPAGCVEVAGISATLPEGSVEWPMDHPQSLAPKLMFDGSAWVIRPVVGEHSLAGSAFSLSDCPIGSRVVIGDADTNVEFGRFVTEEVGLTLDLPDPGHYRIEIEPPQPWQSPVELTFTIEEPVE